MDKEHDGATVEAKYERNAMYSCKRKRFHMYELKFVDFRKDINENFLEPFLSVKTHANVCQTAAS